MPKHIARLLILILAFVVADYAALQIFTADSFFRYGHYRGNAVAEIAADKPKYQSQDYCQPCHAQQFAEWSSSVHNKAEIGKGVKCQVCHGAGGGRDDKGPYEHASTGPEHPKNLKLVVATDTVRQCTWCHERMPGRPGEQRQIEVATHSGAEQCTTCHNPHSPRTFVVAQNPAPVGDAAAGRVKAAVCAGCHGERGISKNLPGPSIAGQRAPYLVAALKAYQSGGRDNPMMGPMAQGLSGVDIDDLAAYFSKQSCRSTHRSAVLAADGRALAAKCANCHGDSGISRQAAWPNLAGQSADYIAAALAAYKAGSRHNATMAAMSQGLNAGEVSTLATYFARSACN